MLAISIVLAGCGDFTRSIYQRPDLDVPAQWHTTLPAISQSLVKQEAWWHGFNDPVLDMLVDKALRTNNDLAAAALKLRNARLNAALTRTNLSPNTAISGSRSDARNLTQGGDTQRSSSTAMTVNYELDLWGRLARLREASEWEAQATEYDRRAVVLSLIERTATAYWQIAELNSEVRTTRESVLSAKDTLRLIRAQQDVGKASEFEVAQVQTVLESLKADLSQITKQLEASRNDLAIVFDQAPSHREPELEALPIQAMPPLPAVMPASVLSQRPDLMAAEARLRETLANADATRVSFYPTLSLFSSTVSTGIGLADILKNPIGTLGATLSLPFVQFNSADLVIRSSRTSFDLAVSNFKQTFYKALSDVETALAACANAEREVTARRDSLDAARRAESLARLRYRAASTTLTEWLTLQQARQTSEIQLEQAVYNRYVSQLTLYLAIGGDPW
ncbi:hypothetical protein WT83_28945 [Burkholderia territorii]|uniref:RND transporter n=1 Tax=Burkholderia territorii TaxID=1503055 RepID=A0A119VDD6_9BURK|nr:efflux transporter outer membrane subunit [Burkholderia territorii]KWN05594.1 hypothetical protein WT83_28945 [Burkholderia territorii]